MNQFSQTSIDRLNTCAGDLQTIFYAVLEDDDHSILCGHRGETAQNEAFDNGVSELRWPDSEHNTYPSMAVDAAPYFGELRNTDWEDGVAFGLFAGKVIAKAKQLYKEGKITHQLIWGGDWDSDGRTGDHNFKDYPHYQLTKENVWNL